MSGIIPNIAEPPALSDIRAGLDGAYLRLFEGATVPDDATVLADLTQPSWEGYAGIVLDAWDVVVEESGRAVLTHPPRTFQFVDEVADPPLEVAGYFVALGSPAATLRLVERFEDEFGVPTPIVLDVTNKGITVNVRLTLRGELVPPAPPILVSDTFTDTDGTGLADHTPEVGGAWTVVSGTWQIQGNRAQNTAAGGVPRAEIDAGTPDVDVTCTVRPHTVADFNGTLPGIGVRRTAGGSYWLVRLTRAFGAGEGVQLLQVDDSETQTTRLTHAATIANDTDYLLRVRAEGDILTAWLDGVKLFAWNVAGHADAGTKVVLSAASFTTSGGQWDNLLVEGIP